MTMSKQDQINAVALTLQDVMTGINSYYDALVGTGQHNIVLVVGAADTMQYIANRERKFSIELLSGLLSRWKVGLEDVIPDGATQGDTKPFEYLLNAFEQASQHAEPATQDYANKRLELLNYVGRLVAKANRT